MFALRPLMPGQELKSRGDLRPITVAATIQIQTSTGGRVTQLAIERYGFATTHAPRQDTALPPMPNQGSTPCRKDRYRAGFHQKAANR